jgi:hypothetical protein
MGRAGGRRPAQQFQPRRRPGALIGPPVASQEPHASSRVSPSRGREAARRPIGASAACVRRCSARMLESMLARQKKHISRRPGPCTGSTPIDTRFERASLAKLASLLRRGSCKTCQPRRCGTRSINITELPGFAALVCSASFSFVFFPSQTARWLCCSFAVVISAGNLLCSKATLPTHAHIARSAVACSRRPSAYATCTPCCTLLAIRSSRLLLKHYIQRLADVCFACQALASIASVSHPPVAATACCIPAGLSSSSLSLPGSTAYAATS